MWRYAVLLCLIPCVARAQSDADPSDALIAEGLELRRRGEDERALARFAEAYELSRAPRALVQTALAEQALGRWVDAERHLTEALAGADAWVEERRALLEQALVEIGTHLGSLEVLASVEGAEVLIDGRSVGRTPLGAVRLPIGTISLEVRAEGHRAAQRRVEISRGLLSRETITMVAVAPIAAPPIDDAPREEPRAIAPPDERAPPSDRREPLLVAGAVVGGVGAAAVIGALAALGVREGHVQRFNSEDCLPATGTRLDACAGEFGAGHVAEDLSLALFVVGAAALAGAGVLFGLAVSMDQRAPSVACAPSLGGVACRGRF